MPENPTAKCEKFWFRASLLINFGRASIVVSVGCVANYACFSDLVLFQLKRTCLQIFKKSSQVKKFKKNLLLISNLLVSQPVKGQGPIKYKLVLLTIN